MHAAAPATSSIPRPNRAPGLDHVVLLGPADPTRTLSVGVSLSLRNQAALESFIAQVSDRQSPSYGHYLTPEQFAANYGPTQGQVQQVVDYLRSHGLVVTGTSSNRTLIDATGSVVAVQSAFGVTISNWHDGAQNRDFYGNDTQPVLPTSLASYVVGVSGLNNHYPLQRLGPAPRMPPGGGPAGGYTPNDLKKAYDVTPLASAGFNGSGQSLGLFELDGFRQSNITTYDTQYGLGSPAPSAVRVDGGSGSLGMGEVEVELDIEVMHALAPASPITVWEGPNTDPGANDTYNAIVTSNTTKSNSTSWGICEQHTTQAEMTTLDNIFQQAAAQGQSFFSASGDYGAYDCGGTFLSVDSPANDPYVTGTGGTTLMLNADGTYKTESAWSNPNYSPPLGSGGGLSTYFARPSWQAGPGVSNGYSSGKRQVPDISSDADPNTGYSVYVTIGGTGWTVVGGTSGAAPSWAAFTAVYNQYAAANGKPNLGYANPNLYSTGSNAQPYSPYHDVTTGDNLYYAATSNWDYATGWGTYDANNLARDLAGILTLTSVQASNVNSTSAVITWQTDRPANSRVDYGTTTGYVSSVADSTNVISHAMTISGLANNTTYHFKATSTDALAHTGASPDGVFTTSTNLLSNGGLELGATGWSLAPQATIDTNPVDAHAGNNSLKLVATAGWQGTGQHLAISPGQSYSFTGWGRSTNAGGTFTIYSFAAGGTFLSSAYFSFAGTGTWAPSAGTYVAPSTAASLDVVPQSVAPGTFWFDDVSLAPTNDLAANGGFELGSAGWSLAPQASIDTNPTDAHAGSNSLKLVATAGWQGTGQHLAISPGQSYSFTGWGRSASSGGTFTVYSFNASGNFLSSSYFSFSGTGSWVAAAGTYVAPASATSVEVVPQSVAPGTFLFDDISLIRG